MRENDFSLSYNQKRLAIGASFDKYQPYLNSRDGNKLVAEESVVRFSHEIYNYLYKSKKYKIVKFSSSFFSSKNTETYKAIKENQIFEIQQIIMDVIDIIDEENNPRDYTTPPLRVLKRHYPHI